MTNAYVVVGLGFGDEGKGSWVDHLVRKHSIRYTVRFNGGAQALHHVVTPEGVVHGFSQFGSATFVANTQTILSNYMLVEPLALIKEAEVLQSKGIEFPFDRLIVSENAPIITPFHIFLNQVKEINRGEFRHGSCGFGIGETQNDVDNTPESVIYMKDLQNPLLLREKLTRIYQQKLELFQSMETLEVSEILNDFKFFDIEDYCDLLCLFAEKIRIVSDDIIQSIISKNNTVFEGAQGVLLDQQYGFFPYCTRSNSTFINAEALLKNTGSNIIKVGLLRAYGTRHGAGPFVTESQSLDISSCHNSYGEWQKGFRLGWFDGVLARYALDVTGKVDILAITNLDRLYGQSSLKIADSYISDSVFFPKGEIDILPVDYSLLEQRSNEMMDIQANYILAEGFEAFEDSSCREYIQVLSRVIGHKIHAVSLRADCEKQYLVNSCYGYKKPK